MGDAPLRIDYRLTGAGWAECDIVFDGVTVHLTASYLSDALGQLAAAAVLLLLGAPSARVSFDEEPGEYRWGFDWHRSPNEGVSAKRVRVWRFPDLWGHRPDEDGEIVFDQVIASKSVYGALLTTLDNVLAKHGLDEYAKLWHGDTYPFPTALHEEMRRLIEQRKDLS